MKSTAVILVLAGVLYGVYTALNKQESPPPPGMTAKDVEDLAPPAIDFSSGSASGPTSHLPAPPTTLTPPSTESPASELHSTTAPAAGSKADSLYAPRRRDAQPSTSPPASSDAASASFNQQSSFESPAADASRTSLSAFSLRRDLATAEQQIQESKLRAALATLSPYYSQSDLSAEDRAQLVAWLDALAAKVIYSREHLLDSPYQVRGSETLFDIAERCHVPAELLQNINGVSDPRVLLPNTTLKLVPGPLRAEVNISTSELTVYLGDLYAGRFPFTLGNEPPPPGDFEVKDRQPERTYYSADGRTIAANDPTNPYGQCWIDLGASACIHGSPLSPAPGAPALGCISLSPQDARDVYSILSRGSRVVIKR
ncbi:MAG: L,D-transpeptidase family protein [Planctomycetaceae bacterium]|nr:L,D-transpeptidase family protein [Planctomycetaceae bacterium]